MILKDRDRMCPTALCPTNPTRTDLGANPGLRDEKQRMLNVKYWILACVQRDWIVLFKYMSLNLNWTIILFLK